MIEAQWWGGRGRGYGGYGRRGGYGGYGRRGGYGGYGGRGWYGRKRRSVEAEKVDVEGIDSTDQAIDIDDPSEDFNLGRYERSASPWGYGGWGRGGYGRGGYGRGGYGGWGR